MLLLVKRSDKICRLLNVENLSEYCDVMVAFCKIGKGNLCAGN